MSVRDLPCAGCGQLMWRNPKSLPAGIATCRTCRRQAPRPYKHATATVHLTCTACEKPFTREAWRVIPGKPPCCSRGCARELAHRANREREIARVGRATKRAKDRLRCARRRARFQLAVAEPVDPETVFERDGWRCHVCGNAIDRKLSGRHRMGPTLDHLVPISRGGEHTYANVAAAHRACNSRRGITGQAQLALLG